MLPSKPSTRAWDLALAAIVMGILSWSWMFAAVGSPNERTRVYLSVALVDEHALSIDESIARFGPVADLATAKGRTFTDKSPGASVLFAPVYAVARTVGDAESQSAARLVNLVRTWVMLPIGLLGFAALRQVLRRLRFEEPLIDILSLAWICGSTAFHYSTVFFGHQLVAVALLLALLSLPSTKESSSSSAVDTWRCLGAGVFVGFAGFVEYQSAIPCMLFAAFALYGPLRRQPRRIAAFLLAPCAFVALLLTYHTLTFGGPFELPYHHLVSPDLQAVHGEGIGGVTMPSSEAILGGLFSLHRGWFSTAPVFLLTIVGLVEMRRSGPKRLTWLLGATVAYYAFVISSTRVWHGGWGYGPRLLVPVMGLSIIPAAFAARSQWDAPMGQGVVRGLALAGLVNHQLVQAVFPELPPEAGNPLVDVVFPALASGLVAPNLGSKLLHLQGLGSLAPLLLLVSFVAGVILFRGTSVHPRAVRARIAGIAVVIALVPLGAVLLRPPSFGPAQTEDFLRKMEDLSAREADTLARPR